MNQEDLKLLLDWFEEHKDDKLGFIEKQAIKLAIGKAGSVGDLMETMLNLLKKS